MGQQILIGHHSEKRARRDQERMWSMARKSVSEQRRAGYWANRAAASEAYERYRKNPGRTLRRIEKLEAERRGVLRERDGVDDKGRKADVWRREPSEARREELTRRLAEYDEELTYWAETIKEVERRGFKVWGKPDFVRGDFARCGGTWYEVTRVNAKTVTVPHIHAAFDGGAVGAVGGCRVVTRAATEETRHKGSTYTLPYNELSGRMSAEQMQAALAGEAIPADPRDATPEPTPEPTPEEAEAERAADARDRAVDLAQERHQADERTAIRPITAKVGGCCSCGEGIEQPLNGPRPECTHEGTGYPDGSVVVGGYRVTPKGRGRCSTDRHDVDGVALFEARNTVARCGECVAADLGVDLCALPAAPDSSNMSGARQIPGDPSAAADARADAAPADPRAVEEERRRRSPYLSGGIPRVTLAELAAERERAAEPFTFGQRVTTGSGTAATYKGRRGTDGLCWVLPDGDTYPATARLEELTLAERERGTDPGDAGELPVAALTLF